MTDVRLERVTVDNYRRAIELRVGADQRTMVASNAVSLADAWAYPGAEPYVLVHGDALVGFVLLYPMDDEDEPAVATLVRFMIDERWQRRGLGRAGLRSTLDYLRVRGTATVRLTVLPDNAPARRLYGQEGFADTGEMDDDELVMVRDL